MIQTIISDGKAEFDYLQALKARQQETNADVTRAVQDILDDVRREGDAAVTRYSAKFDHAEGPIRVIEAAEIADAKSRIDAELLGAMERAAVNIRRFHQQQVQESYVDFREDGSMMGQRVRPLKRVGLYVPGGTAAYPSSVLMNAIPAKIAGVPELVMVTPPNAEGKPRDVILAAAAVAGVDRIYMVGGAQAVAALAYGTETIPQVDKIVGPGNIFVATAKRLLYGVVDIDMIAGPSEILIVADENADPRFVAADLMSQCEHDVLAGGVLLTDSAALAEAVKGEIARQLETLSRAEIIRQSMADYGVIVVFPDIDACIDYANAVAPEHLELAVAQPEQYLGRVENAGSVFLGDWTPEPVGDYYAGANHVLPTSGTARFFSPLGVDSFYKRMGFTAYSKQALLNGADDIIRFAEAEGLTAHANAVKVRKEQ
ncbi:MAG: histidinol dehydrogenase [Peptococcaceae bacterium]|jgi:histidinol dehydrogenase|nr:histidinol dehydrogenase [Peptococcaceae bacterium]